MFIEDKLMTGTEPCPYIILFNLVNNCFIFQKLLTVQQDSSFLFSPSAAICLKHLWLSNVMQRKKRSKTKKQGPLIKA